MLRFVGFVFGAVLAVTALAPLVNARSIAQLPVVAEIKQWTAATLRRAASGWSKEDRVAKPIAETAAVPAAPALDLPPPGVSATAPNPNDPTPAHPVGDEPKRSWQGVWRPFRSQISANGFAEHLARLTERKYRVRRVRAWAYRVEFAYEDEADRIDTLGQIEDKTGLPLGETEP